MKRTKKHTTKSRSIFIFALVLLMAAFLATPDSVLAQTPLKVFVNADGDTVFVLNEDGGFNAGQLGNLDSQGTTSVALGSFPTASGDQAVAIGAVSQAVGTNAVALGAAKAQGDFSAAMGAGPEASGKALTAASKRRLSRSGPTWLKNWRKFVRFGFILKKVLAIPSNTQIGLLAQEVRKQFPELVSEGSNGYLSLSYTKFTAVLLKGIQEQQAGIEKLQAKIRQSKQLEERLAKLETNRQHGKMVLTRSSVYTPLMLLLLIFVGGTIVFRAFPKKYKSKG